MSEVRVRVDKRLHGRVSELEARPDALNVKTKTTDVLDQVVALLIQLFFESKEKRLEYISRNRSSVRASARFILKKISS